jgi:transposase
MTSPPSFKETSGWSGGATCPPARWSRSSRSDPIDQTARRCESSQQPEQLSVLPTNVSANSYTTSWDLTAGGGGSWTQRHRDWLAGLRFDDRASELCLADYLHAHDVLLARRERLDQSLGALAQESPWSATIARLRCLRGIDTLSALGLCAEASDWGRFGSRQALAAYLGLVPSENSSGERRRQGSITKAGSAHARRLLVEAAHHYRRAPRRSSALERRQRGQQAWVVDFSWRVQRRLNGRWRRLHSERGKGVGLTAVAVARELAGFCWELAISD